MKKTDPHKILHEHQLKKAELNSRRVFLQQCGLSLGALALGSILPSCGNPATITKGDLSFSLNPLQPKSGHFASRAKSIIYLHMAGAPSQFEMFDYKPVLNQLHGQECPPSLLEGKKFAFIRGGFQGCWEVNRILDSMVNPEHGCLNIYPISGRSLMK